MHFCRESKRHLTNVMISYEALSKAFQNKLFFVLSHLTHSFQCQYEKHTQSTLFSKRNASFWKLHFFWGKLCAIGPGILHNFHNASRPYVRVSYPGPLPRKMDRLKLRFFWRKCSFSVYDGTKIFNFSNFFFIMCVCLFRSF